MCEPATFFLTKAIFVQRKEGAYFENSELPRLFAHLTIEPYRTLCLVALKTGMRQGELIALRWSDVDLDDAVARVRSSYTGGSLGTPKNRERRDVDLITDVVELLAEVLALSFHLLEDRRAAISGIDLSPPPKSQSPGVCICLM